MTTARDRPPEEAAEDTSFARGLRILLTIADRGEIRADDLGSTPRHVDVDGLSLPQDPDRVRLRRPPRRRLRARAAAAHRHRRERERRGAHPDRRSGPPDARPRDRRDRDHQPTHRPVRGVPPRGRRRSSRSASRWPADSGPLDAGALARVLLAFAPEEVLDESAARPAAGGRRAPAPRRPRRHRRRRASPGAPASTSRDRWRWPFPSCERTGSWPRSGWSARRHAAASRGGRASRACCPMRRGRSSRRCLGDLGAIRAATFEYRDWYLPRFDNRPQSADAPQRWTPCRPRAGLGRLRDAARRRGVRLGRRRHAASGPASGTSSPSGRSAGRRGRGEARARTTSSPTRRPPRRRASSTTSRGPPAPTARACRSACGRAGPTRAPRPADPPTARPSACWTRCTRRTRSSSSRVRREHDGPRSSFEPYDAVPPPAPHARPDPSGRLPDFQRAARILTRVSAPEGGAAGARLGIVPRLLPGLLLAIVVAAAARASTLVVPAIVSEVTIAVLLGIVVGQLAGGALGCCPAGHRLHRATGPSPRDRAARRAPERGPDRQDRAARSRHHRRRHGLCARRSSWGSRAWPRCRHGSRCCWRWGRPCAATPPSSPRRRSSGLAAATWPTRSRS